MMLGRGAALCLAAMASLAGAGEAEPVASPWGAFGLELRWRAEFVRTATLPRKALGIPLRVRGHYTSPSWRGISLFAELDWVTDFGIDTYNEGGGNTPQRSAWPVIADPAGADLNQAWIQYLDPRGHRLRLGRQRLVYDNARFVGNVGWRQNEQTYDSLALTSGTWQGWTLQLAYVDRVRRIFGRDVAAGVHDHRSWLANAALDLAACGRLAGYIYLVDDRDAAAQSSLTWGARYTGTREGPTPLGFALEYAHQQDARENPLPYSTHYWRIDLRIGLPSVDLHAGWESLGGDAERRGRALRTPLATLHAFNGWADQFLTTPDAGLDDRFAGITGSVSGWQWAVWFHDFAPESGRGAFGSEVDASFSRSFDGGQSLLFKLARFHSPDGRYPDSSKLWVQFSYAL